MLLATGILTQYPCYLITTSSTSLVGGHERKTEWLGHESDRNEEREASEE